MSPLRHLLHLGRMRNSWVLSQGLWRGRWHRMLQRLVQRWHGGDGGCTRLGGHWGRSYGRLSLHCCCHRLLLLLLLNTKVNNQYTVLLQELTGRPTLLHDDISYSLHCISSSEPLTCSLFILGHIKQAMRNPRCWDVNPRVVWQVIPDILKDHGAYVTSTWHGVTSHKTQILSNTDVKTSDLTNRALLSKWMKNIHDTFTEELLASGSIVTK